MAAWPSIRRTLWLVCAALLLLARISAAAGPSLSADFDGDGHGDRVTVDGMQPSVLRIWLSSTNATAEIHSHTPVLRLVARDLDGDRRSELIAGGSAGGLQVWTRKRHGFKSFRPRRTVPADMGRPGRRALDEGPIQSRSAIQWTGCSALVLALSPWPRAPGVVRSHLPDPSTLSLRQSAPHSYFAPRPPPARV